MTRQLRIGLSTGFAVLLVAAFVHASVTLDLDDTNAAGSSLGAYFGPYFPASDVSFNSSAIPNGVQIFGTFSTTGAEYQSITSAQPADGYSGFVTFNGEGNGQADPGSVLNIGYDFSFTFTGGQINSGGVDGDNVLGQSAGGGFSGVTSGQTISGDVQSLPVAGPAFLFGGFWEADINFVWQNYSPTDTLTLTIPDDSLDVTLSPVPEPAAAFSLMAPAMAWLRRPRAAS